MKGGTAVIRTLGIAIGVGITLPTIFGEPAQISDRVGGDTWRNVIYDFQTLITGIFAVGAAWWTVKAMEKTEAATAIRHYEQLALATRGDRLKLQRALYPQLGALRYCHKEIVETICRYETEPRDKDEHPMLAVIFEFHSIFQRIEETINRPHFIEGQTLFDGELNNIVWELGWRAKEAKERAEYACRLHSGDEIEFHETLSYEHLDDVDNDSQIIAFARHYRDNFENIEAGLRRMAELYDLLAPNPQSAPAPERG